MKFLPVEMSCGNPNQPLFHGIMSAQFNVVDRFLTGVLFFEVFIYGEGLELSDWGGDLGG